MSLRTFQIYIPLRNEPFESKLLDAFGGFTDCGDVWGQWKDDKGKVHSDGSHVYQVSTPLPFVDAAGLVRVPVPYILNGWARDLFPKEQAFYVAHIGTAEILSGKGQPKDGDSAPG
jgi:hypothetical protein